MAKYLIHTCAKREQYVNEYLVPSMLKQGIDKSNILIYNDKAKEGCLKSYLASFKMIASDRDGTWHLQDDVLISSWFKRITEEANRGIVCGFCSYYSEDKPYGLRPVQDMWYSFPCIRIPNMIAKRFVEWLESPKIQNKYKAYIEENKFVDYFFRLYVLENYTNSYICNLNPNIVENIDYLLGGSVINYIREDTPNSLYFKEHNLVEEFKNSTFYNIYTHK